MDYSRETQQARLHRAMSAPIDRSPTLDSSAMDEPPCAQDVQDLCWAVFAVALLAIPVLSALYLIVWSMK